MKFFLSLVLFFPSIILAAPLDCTWNGTENIDVSAAADNTIDCTSFTVNNGGGAVIVHSGGTEGSNTVLTINVSGDVMIDEAINLSGGASGANIPGPGGFAGGTFPGGFVNGNAGNGPTNSNGKGGIKHDDNGNGAFICGGGGGSGGSHSATTSAGQDGTDSGGGVCNNTANLDGIGGASPTTTYGEPEQFFTTILGGSGGGAGGAGENGSGVSIAGARGGSGGGAIRIIANGDITLTTNASINADGESGVDGGDGGSGGGGSGGAIYLASKGQITLQAGATFSAQGGLGATSSGNGGSGSDGSDGYVRLEDSDGLVTGISGASTPAATLGTFGTSPVKTFESDISPGCALRKKEVSFWPLITFIGIALGILLLTRIQAKFNRSTIHWQKP